MTDDHLGIREVIGSYTAKQNEAYPVCPSSLRLIYKVLMAFRIDDEIHERFLELFPEYKFEEALRVLDEDKMKSAGGKEKWRSFIMPVSPILPFQECEMLKQSV
jgi:hypothetical protein